jgi:hypothetical protein
MIKDNNEVEQMKQRPLDDFGRRNKNHDSYR